MQLQRQFRHFIKKNKKVLVIFCALQIMNIVYSLSSVLIKCASLSWELNGFFSLKTISILFMAVAILGIYAALWQMILSKVDLSVAYMCKGMIVFWGVFWAALFFHEIISIFNILGTILICTGTFLVMKYE